MNPHSAMLENLTALFERAFSHHTSGNIRDAERLYRAVLRLDDKHFDALHLIGVIQIQKGEFESALRFIDRALVLNPHSAPAHSHRGTALSGLKRLDEALASYSQALNCKPNYAEAYLNRGLIFSELKRFDEARADYDRSVAIKPDYAEALCARGDALLELKLFAEAVASFERAIAIHADRAETHFKLGNALEASRRIEAALESYDRAIALKPQFAQAHVKRGNVLKELERLEEALASYDRAIEIRPSYPAAHANRGNVLKALKRLEEALTACDKAIALKPDYALAHYNRGVALMEMERLDDALASYDTAIAIKPGYAAANNNQGLLLAGLDRLDEALASYDRAIAFDPNYAPALNNRGLTLLDLNRSEEALASFERALAVKPDYADPHWNKSLATLLHGDFEQGWKHYEWRWKRSDGARPRDLKKPLWLGRESIRGQRILLHAEQGLGDTIQFCRYAEAVAARGAHVVLEVQKPLETLVGSLKGVHEICARGKPLPPFGVHCPLMSLPLAFETRLDTIPAGVPYLASARSKIDQWRRRLAPDGRPIVGIAWSGSAGHKRDANRSILLSRFLPLLESGAQFVSLQKDVREVDAGVLRAHPAILPLGEELDDFSDTAALISLIDLVISVDTSVAHLAGALAIPVWILLPFAPDWRWLLDRDDSPWYPTAKLFRQKRPGDWSEVIASVRTSLDQLATDATQASSMQGHRVPVISDSANAHFDRGNALTKLNRCEEALASYERAIAIKPDFAEAFCNRAKALGHLKHVDEALASYERAIAVKPLSAVAHAGRGNMLMQLQRFDEALPSYDAAIAIQPELEGLYVNRGNALERMNRLDDALASYGHEIAIRPDFAAAYFNRGTLLMKQKRLDAALADFDKAIAIRPDYAEVHTNRGNALSQLNRIDEALASHDKAIATKPDLEGAYLNRGDVLERLDRLGDALACYDKVIAINPAFAEAYSNRGNTLRRLMRTDEAMASYDKALALKPDYSGAHWNRSILFLLLGDLGRGWREYEWRWQATDLKDRRMFKQPPWLGGEDIRGKRIFLHAEQGLGDTIQFCRFAELVSAQGAYIILEVQKALKPLLSALSGVGEVIAAGGRTPDFDYHCPLLSLPLAFETRLETISARVPYLSASPDRIEKWRTRMGARGRLSVGLVWSGAAAHKNDRNRSIPLERLLPLLQSGAQFVSLQKDVRETDAAVLRAHPEILHFGDEVADFSDTAALASLLDLVISVDTSVAHLAGALAIPVWVLLPFAPDWRWLLDRDDSPWYPTARLFRQPQIGDWHAVVVRVCDSLAQFLQRRVATGKIQAESEAQLQKVADLVERALKDQASGNLGDAEASLRAALRLTEQHFPSLHLMGVVHLQQRRFASALEFIDRALAVDSRSAAAHVNRGIALKELKRCAEALASCDQAIALAPKLAPAHFSRGLALADLGRLTEAVASYDTAIAIAPAQVQAHASRGLALMELRQFEAALASYEKAIALDPARAEGHFERGNAMSQLRRFEGALESYDAAIAIRREFAEAHANRGNVLAESQRHAEALASYDKAIALKPDYADAYSNRGNALKRLGRMDDAIADYDRAIAVKPEIAEFHVNRGNALRDSKQLEEALASYDLALANKPDCAEAHSNRGLALAALERFGEALASFDRALAIKSDDSHAHCHRANVLAMVKRYDEALASCDRAAAINPRGVEAHVQRGNVLLKLRRFDEALTCYDKAIAIQPDYADAYVNRGISLKDLLRFDEALASFDRALAIKPDDAEAHCNRGNVLKELARFDEALADYDRAISIKPDFAEAYSNRGNVFSEREQFERALADYEKAIAIQPDLPEAHVNRGNALKRLERLDDALASYDTAISIEPDFAGAHYNRAVALDKLARRKEALESYDRAIAIMPDLAEAHCGRGNVLRMAMRVDEALASYDRAIAIKPDYVDAYWNKSLVTLMRGDLVRGLPLYERRWQKSDAKPSRKFEQPLWLGRESLKGKRVLLHAEQGLGDTIQFCRYAELAAGQGAHVVLAVQKPLKALLAGLEGVAEICGGGERLPQFDCHCPLLSLPLAFETRLETIPARVPYLSAAPARIEKWRARMGAPGGLTVGLAWSGSVKHKNDKNRSIALSRLLPLLDSGARFVSLQKDLREPDAAILSEHPQILQLGAELQDFSDTAAVASLLDLVISVDTSVAHLAGALAKPVWILLPFVPDWRWLIDRDDSPWYPTARLFRQEKSGDWGGVIERVKATLTERTGNNAPRT